MAKDHDAKEEKKEPVQFFRLKHNLDSGQIISIYRVLQRHYGNMPGCDVSLDLMDKEGDENGVYFRATQSQADEVLADFEKKASDWDYNSANFSVDIVQKEPEGMLTAEIMNRIEKEVAGSIQEELGRLYMKVGSLQANLLNTTSKITGLEEKCRSVEFEKDAVDKAHTRLKKECEELEKVYSVFKKGNLVDAVGEMLRLRVEKVSDIEFMLSEIRDSGLDLGLIANPPESIERFVASKIARAFEIDYHDLTKRLRIGADEWEKSEIYVDEFEQKDAIEKVDALVKSIVSSDEKIRQILVDNLGGVIDSFRKKIAEYDGKRENWQKAREIFFAYQEGIERAKGEVAAAKGLQGCISDIRQVKLPVYAVPEQDSITLFTPVSKGILYDSLISAIVAANVNISSEPQVINGNTVLRITPKNGFKPIDMLNSIKDSYQNTEAGKTGNKLGLIVQL